MTAHPENRVRHRSKRAGLSVLIAAAVVVVAAGGGYLLYQRRAGAGPTAAAVRKAATAQRVPVVTTPVARRDFERSLVVQGNVEAKNSAMVSPRIPGTIERIYVDEGDPVSVGKTRLFQTDAVTLEKNVQIARHNRTVAACATREARASLEKTKADFHKAKLDYERFSRLFEQKAVTADAFEQQESRYRQLQAAVTLAEAQVDLTAAQEDQAAAALEIAEKNLADAMVGAPISGTVSERFREPGEMGHPGEAVLRIDDTSVVEIAAFLPAEYYAAVKAGQTAARIRVSGTDPTTHTVTYKSPTINAKLRTFEVKCLLEDPPGGIIPGAMAEIAIVLESRPGIGVPSGAVQDRGGRAVVFLVGDGVAHQVAVDTGMESHGWTEILSRDLAEGAPIVTMGQYMLEEGTPVNVQQEAR